MGLCFSCFESNQSTVDDENTSLLSDDRARIIESELLTELRNKQLNAILNSTNDHMIDISTIKMMSTYGSDNNNNSTDINESQHHDDEEQDHEPEIFKVVPISQSVIQDEIDRQNKEWISQLGEHTVRKYLTVTDPNTETKKYTVDFV